MAKVKPFTAEPDQEESNGAPKKKKKHCCRNCCITILVIFLVIFVGVIGAGWYFGDKYSKQYFGMDIGHTIGVLQGLYGTKQKDVVKNGPSATDEEAFYSELKTQLMLKDDVELNIGEIVDLMTAEQKQEVVDIAAPILLGALGLKPTDNSANAVSVSSAEDGSETGGKSANAITDILVKYISTIFTSENINKEELARLAADVEEGEVDPIDALVFNLSDRSLCAFLNSIINIMFTKGEELGVDLSSITDSLSTFGIDISTLTKNFKLSQIVFSTAPKVNEITELSGETVTVSATVWVGLESIAKQAVKGIINTQATQFKWAAGFAEFVVGGLLPKNLFATVEIGLNESTLPRVIINDMGAIREADTYKIVNGIMNISSTEPVSIQETLRTAIDTSLDSLRPTINEIMDFEKAGNGVISVDFYSTMIDLAGLNKDAQAEEDKLTKKDLIKAMDLVLASDADAQLKSLQDYYYEGWYIANEEPHDIVFDPIDKTKYTKIDYSESFVNELKSKFALDLPDGTSGTEMLKLLGVDLTGGSSSAPDTTQIMNLLSAQKLILSTKGVPLEDLKVKITDRMLGALLAPQVTSMISSAGSGLPELTLEALGIEGTANNHTHLMLALSMPIKGLTGLMGEGSATTEMIASLITGLMPGDKIVLTVTIDATLNLAKGDVYDSTKVLFNDRDANSVFNILKKLNVMDVTALLNDYLEPVRDILKSIDDLIGITLVGSNETDRGALTMPDVYTLITKMALTDTNEETGEAVAVMTPDNLRDVIVGLYDTEAAEKEDTDFNETHADDIANGEAHFISEMGSKYYLNTTKADGAPMTKYDELMDSLSNFNADMLMLKPSAEDVASWSADTQKANYQKYLAYDNRTADALHPEIKAAWLMSIVKDSLSSAGGDLSTAFKIAKFDTTNEGEIVLLLSIDMAELLGTDIDSAFNTLLPAKIYAQATVDTKQIVNDELTGSPIGYQTSFKINTMDTTVMENFEKLISKFMSSGAFDLGGYANEVGMQIYSAFSKITEALGSFTVNENGIILPGFYDFLKSKTGLSGETDYSAGDVQSMLQGMYTVPEGMQPSDFVKNYDTSIMLPNKSTDFVHNQGATYTPTDVYNGNVVATDKWFNGMLSKTIQQSAQSISTIQTVALSNSNISSGDGRAFYDYMSAYIPNAADSNIVPKAQDDLLLYVTVELGMDNLNSSGSSSEIASQLFSDSVYATLIFKLKKDLNDSNKYKANLQGVRVNAMTLHVQNCMGKMFGLDINNILGEVDSGNDGSTISIKVLFEIAFSTLFTDVTGITITTAEGGGNEVATVNSIGKLTMTNASVIYKAAIDGI